MTTSPGPFDWVIRFVVEWLLIFTFSCLLLPALWKLTKSRPSLIIVFSRAISNYLGLFGFMPQHMIYDIFNIPIESKSYYLAYKYSLNASIYILSISPHLHNLALAVNRSHAMFFPFHYNMVFTKKKNIYLLCLCLWLICICVGGSNEFVVFTLKLTSPRQQLNMFCMYASGLFYIALGCRMFWMRYKKSSTINGGASSEKDSIKILVVCFTCLVMSALNQLVFLPLVIYGNTNFTDTMLDTLVIRWDLVIRWGSFSSQWLIFCTEEICLALLVRDFRRNVKQQLRSVFCCCRGNSIEPTDNSYNTATKTTEKPPPIRVAKIIKVNTLMINEN